VTWKTSLTIAAASLILAGSAMAQTPSPGGNPGPRWRAVPEHPEPHYPDHARRPDSAHARTTTPGLPGSSTPGMSDPTPGVQCPPGQARRPGSSICMPAMPGAPLPPPTTR
jgi:hypothetical protein